MSHVVTPVGPYEVTVYSSETETVTLTTGYGKKRRQEPRMWAVIRKDGKEIARVSHLNCTMMCVKGGGVSGPKATPAQIVEAVLGDEDIFTGSPSFPRHHDAAIALAAS